MLEKLVTAHATGKLQFFGNHADLAQPQAFAAALAPLPHSENHLIARAAVAGQGLALVRDIYADDDLRSKTLVEALRVNWPVQFAYYAVATSEALQTPAGAD
jgi:DNA-binding transcriptional LysR family regulator